MRVISVVNYKGGVGKTTLTANLGAGLAQRGKRVLIVDLDPQCSLTHCFYTPEDYQLKIRPYKTMKRWYDGFVGGLPTSSLADFVVAPPLVNASVGHDRDRLHLLASDMLLFRLDLEAAMVAAKDDIERELFHRRRSLLDGLSDPTLALYDFVLLDCPPNFGLQTQSALVASRDVIIPTKADYMSTAGSDVLYNSIYEFRADYGKQVHKYGGRHAGGAFDMGEHRVVFTMVQHYGARPESTHRFYMDHVQLRLNMSSFTTFMRQSVAAFGQQPGNVPAVLGLKPSDRIRIELNELLDEFIDLFKPPGGRVAAA